MQRPGVPGANWPPPPRPLAPPLGQAPPPPPPKRPLAPPLRLPPPPPPPVRPPVPSSQPTFHSPPLPPYQPPSSTAPPPPPPPPPPSDEPPPLPPQPSHKHATSTQKTFSPLSTTASDSSPVSSTRAQSDRTSGAEKSPTDNVKGFGGMKFKGGGVGLGKRSGGGSISMKIGGALAVPESKKPKISVGSRSPVKKPALVSQAFGNDSDDEEEMPPEARLRMRNVGKDTPTSAGPNSFYKGKMGFSDPRAGYKRYNDDD